MGALGATISGANTVPLHITSWRVQAFASLPQICRQLKGEQHLFNRLHLLIWRLQYVLTLGRAHCVLYFAALDGKLVHYTVVQSRDFRFPFMSHRDIQVGPVWTHPMYRGKGIASTIGRLILSRLAQEGWTRVWWICRTDNEASIRTALDLGLARVGTGLHSSPFGLRILGSYILDSPAS